MEQAQRIRSIAFVSGKGGVGQTSVLLNLAFSLNQLHKKTLVFDASYTTFEMEELLGIHFSKCLQLNDGNAVDIDALITCDPGGISFLPSDINQQRDCAPTLEQQYNLIDVISKLKTSFDYFLIDVPSCADKSKFLLASATDEIIFIIDEEPASHIGAYWIIQTFVKKYGINRFGVIANRVRSKTSGLELFSQLEACCYESAQESSVKYYGSLCKDNHVMDASKNHKLVSEHYPHSRFSRSLTDVAINIDSRGHALHSKGTIEFFPMFGS